jgi:hypothetical protein
VGNGEDRSGRTAMRQRARWVGVCGLPLLAVACGGEPEGSGSGGGGSLAGVTGGLGGSSGVPAGRWGALRLAALPSAAQRLDREGVWRAVLRASAVPRAEQRREERRALAGRWWAGPRARGARRRVGGPGWEERRTRAEEPLREERQATAGCWRAGPRARRARRPVGGLGREERRARAGPLREERPASAGSPRVANPGPAGRSPPRSPSSSLGTGRLLAGGAAHRGVEREPRPERRRGGRDPVVRLRRDLQRGGVGGPAAARPGERERAIRLLFDAVDGARFAFGRIPIGASDYALDRYTLCEQENDSRCSPSPSRGIAST